MKHKNADIGFSLLIALMGAAMFMISFRYEFMSDYGPGPGFIPRVVTALLAVLGVVNALKIKAQGNSDKPFFAGPAERKRFLIYLGAIILLAIGIEVVGLLISGCIFLFCIYYFFDKKPLVKSLVVAVGITLILWLIFDVWLKLRLPMGLLSR